MQPAPHLVISLERFAELQAQLDGGRPLPEVLAEAELPETSWQRARMGWLERIGDEAKRGHLELGQRYQRAYVASCQPEPEEPQAPEAGDVDGTSVGMQIDWGGALPFFDADDEGPEDQAVEPADEPAEAVEPEEEHPDVGATQFGTALKLGDILPFEDDAAATAEAEAPPAPVPGQAPHPSAAGHGYPAPPPSTPSGAGYAAPPPSVPGHAAPPPSVPGPVAPPPAAPGPAAPARADDVDATGFVSSIDFGEEALPFQGQRAAPTPVADELPEDRGSSVDATGFVSSIDFGDALPFEGDAPADGGSSVDATGFASAVDVGEALPFEDQAPRGQTTQSQTTQDHAPSSPSSLPLTVDQYASFCVERRMWPGRDAELARRYNLDPAQIASVDEAFRQVLTEPQQLATYQEAAARYEAWLRQQGS